MLSKLLAAFSKSGDFPYSFTINLWDDTQATVGNSDPECRIYIKNKAGFNDIDSDYLWRMFLVLYASTFAAMIKSDYFCTAYRIVLELPTDHRELSS